MLRLAVLLIGSAAAATCPIPEGASPQLASALGELQILTEPQDSVKLLAGA